jgi:hypothetical protein
MKASTNFFFAVAAFLVSVGCWELFSGFSGAGFCFCVAIVFYLPRREFRSLPLGELWLTLGVLLAFAALLFACEFFVPSSSAAAIRRVVCHPAFVLPFWLFMLWGLYRRWQIQKLHADA